MAAGHDVLTVNKADMAGLPDDQVLDYARQHNRILLTRNCDDFHTLHRANSDHPGILAIYQDTEPAKNMNYPAIVKAIGNLEVAGLDLANQFVVLNRWQF
jgi:predicted nuclease of predicted toxin-antitoxin system